MPCVYSMPLIQCFRAGRAVKVTQILLTQNKFEMRTRGQGGLPVPTLMPLL